MASTVLVKDVLRRASILLEDFSAQFTGWSQQELVDHLNDACIVIYKFLPAAGSRVDAIKLKPGTRQTIEQVAASDCIPGDGTTPTAPIFGNSLIEVTRNMGVDGVTPGRVIRGVTRDTMDSVSPDWHTKTGSYVKSFMYDARTPRVFYVTPAVLGTQWVEIAWTAQPVRVPNTGSEDYSADGTSTETIKIPDQFLDEIVNFIVAKANMKDSKLADANKAAAFTNLFTGGLNAIVKALTGNSPGLTTLPTAG